ncbi:MAG TPA: TIGR01777 family oxidoreductase [Candidatus Omnitrophota bacterium]|nr:TIGR01777 family oxidoreductase [Candidatus Omnitrophota bacterium]
MKIVACGMSGLIGSAILEKLSPAHEIVVLRRGTSRPFRSTAVRSVMWEPPKIGDWVREIDGAQAVINLSGESIAGKRWTTTQKKELRESRLGATKALVDAMVLAKTKPAVFLSASAIGFYGPRNEEVLSEASPSGAGFLAGLCREWEGEALRASELGIRTVLLRTGIVLAKNGGALSKMVPPFKLFIGGALGSGRQVMSWIHLEDEVGGILKCLEDDRIKGPVNLTAPNAVNMSEFARSLGRVLKRPSLLPVPGFALKLLLGEMSELLLTGQNVAPKALLSAGYTFKHPKLEPALVSLLS